MDFMAHSRADRSTRPDSERGRSARACVINAALMGRFRRLEPNAQHSRWPTNNERMLKSDGGFSKRTCATREQREQTMGRYLLLFLLGVPLPILVLIWLLGGLH